MREVFFYCADRFRILTLMIPKTQDLERKTGHMSEALRESQSLDPLSIVIQLIKLLASPHKTRK